MNIDLLWVQAKQVCLRILPMNLRARLSGVKMGGGKIRLLVNFGLQLNLI